MRLRDLGGLIVIDFIDMDESKNRREVESRLRDALRQDRARVQFGSISKFGLMEMSRQRLKPALSEGSSIPCPRCGGSGHIRDTESSALQILRIIQEESMKDNTAAVHVQVPVEVASFLLNEKRPEIAKIELKQRVTVLMVPNKTLETPNYKLERLKHDDPRLDHIEASYKMADEIEDPTSVTRRSQEPTNRQTPVIKGVLPDAPAPVVAPKPEAVQPPAAAPAPVAPQPAASPEPAEAGFFGWIKRLFGAPPAPAQAPVVIPVEAPKPRREGRGARDGEPRTAREGEQRRGGRGEGRSGEGRSGEGRGGERRGGRTGERREGERREGREARAETRSDAPIREPREPREAREAREARTPRDGERRGRGERRDNEPRQTPVDAENQLDTQALVPNGPVTDEGAPPAERAPRGRGERRERGERSADAVRDSGNDAAQPDAERGARSGREERAPRGERGEGRRERRGEGAPRTTEASPAVEASPGADSAAEAVAGDGAPRREGDERRSRSRDRYGRDRRERGPREEADAGAAALPLETADANGAAELGGLPERPERKAAPIAPIAAVAPIAPIVVDTPAVRTRALPKVQAYELPTDELAQIAEGSGLQWVNSNAERVAEVRAAIAAEPRPVHVPRERPPAAELDEGPLILVETRRDLGNVVLPFEQPGREAGVGQ
jgi:ribonuclease E